MAVRTKTKINKQTNKSLKPLLKVQRVSITSVTLIAYLVVMHDPLRHGLVQHLLVPLLQSLGLRDLLIHRVTVEDVVIALTGWASPYMPRGIPTHTAKSLISLGHHCQRHGETAFSFYAPIEMASMAETVETLNVTLKHTSLIWPIILCNIDIIMIWFFIPLIHSNNKR